MRSQTSALLVVALALLNGSCATPAGCCSAPPSTPSEVTAEPERDADGDVGASAEVTAEPERDADGDLQSPTSEGAKALAWLSRCLLENAAPHPKQPWLAVACTDSKEERGAVMVLDGATGTIRQLAPRDGYVGWSSWRLLQWHADGRRIASNIDTNGIGLVDGARWTGWAFPDETRDHGVGYVWVDERLYADTGAFFKLESARSRFDFDEQGAPAFQQMAWNPSIKAVVGNLPGGLGAWDPVREKLVYRTKVDGEGAKRRPSVSPDGKWGVRWEVAIHPAPDELLFFNGTTGKVHGRRKTASPRIGRRVWGPGGVLAVSSHVHHIGGPSTDHKIDLFRAGEPSRTLDLGRRRLAGSYGLADVHLMTWSPDGQDVALLLDGQEVRVHDGLTGVERARFHAPAAKVPSGLPRWYTHRGNDEAADHPGGLLWLRGGHLVRVAPHFVSFWSLDGTKTAELVVPTGADSQ